jgi:hypothetical protein
VKDCFLDLASAKGISPPEFALIETRGAISGVLKARILAELANPIALLSDAHRKLALANLT